jgi:hypothetical protein
MAFSNDRGRHRRGRWWRRGSYLFSRRGEAPPDADRSIWVNDSPSRRTIDASPASRGRRPGREEGMENRGRLWWPARRRSAAERRDTRPDAPGHMDGPGGSRRQGTIDGRNWPGAPATADGVNGFDGIDGFGWPLEDDTRPWEPGDRRRRGWERPVERPSPADRPQYTWHDFELDDMAPRAQPNRPDAPVTGDGLLHCGKLEKILHRQWDARQGPPSLGAVRAVESLARLPDRLKEKLADGLSGIYVGAGGVPDLDDMGYLRGAPLPSGRASWDICAGAYGERKIVVGDRPSPTPDVMMHEVGHAIDDVDSAYGDWVSDSPEFVRLYEELGPLLVSAFHRQGGGLGRKEFFADAFAAIASRQRPALVDMLGGDTRTALDVMLFFNRRYGI